jgi:hypothetical protein
MSDRNFLVLQHSMDLCNLDCICTLDDGNNDNDNNDDDGNGSI